VDAIDNKGRTPLHHLIVQRRSIKPKRTSETSEDYGRRLAEKDRDTSRYVREFLTYNPSVNFQDGMGRTALDCALALSLERTVAVLIEHGALASGAKHYNDNDVVNYQGYGKDYEDVEWRYVLDLLSKKEISQRSLPAVLEEASL